MKSIQTKIILLLLVTIIVCSFVIGGNGIISANKAIETDSMEIMNLLSGQNAEGLNSIFEGVEHSVDTLRQYSIDSVRSVQRLSTDVEYCADYTYKLDALANTVVENTEGAVAVYIRFNPEIAGPKAGFYTVYSEERGKYISSNTTDLSLYASTDTEYVGWYYAAVEAGAPVWMAPYYSQRANEYLVSYVAPIYKADTLIGVVGMDVSFDYIADRCDEIQIYDSGYAFIVDENFNVLHSKTEVGNLSLATSTTTEQTLSVDKIDMGYNLYEYKVGNVKHQVVFKPLNNNTYLGITAPVSEIEAVKNALIFRICTCAVVIGILFVVVGAAIAKTIIQPLKELNVAARRIANGNLDIDLKKRSDDEVGTLTESLSDTVDQLKKYINHINSIAYVDEFTGLNNKTAYANAVAEMEEDIKDGYADFSLAVMDINGLKEFNDTYGLPKGDELVLAVSKEISNMFGQENAYRIEGDKFVILLKEMDNDAAKKIVDEFCFKIRTLEGDMKPSVAVGVVTYEKNSKDNYEKLFKKANEAMHEDKQNLKAMGDRSRIK